MQRKKAGVAILTSDKIDFKTKAIKIDKQGHYIILQGSIQQEGKAFIYICAPSIGAPKYIRKSWWILMKRLTAIVIVGNLNTSLSLLDRSSGQKYQQGNSDLK